MKKNYFIALISLSAALGLGSCSHQGKPSVNGADSIKVDTPEAQTDSMATDSMKYAHEDSMVTVKLYVDYPKSNDATTMNIIKFINETLNIPYFMDDSSKPKGYAGSLTDGQTMIDFYGKRNTQVLLDAYKETSSYGDTPSYYYDVKIMKANETPKYITYSVQTYTYLGGAHGSSSWHGVNFNKATGKRLETTIDTTKVKEMQSLLKQGIVEYFHNAGEKNVNKKNLNGWLLIDNDIIPLPGQQPHLTPEGLRFIYGQYEIAPYAVGIIEFTVPYKDVQKYMTREALTLINHN